MLDPEATNEKTAPIPAPPQPIPAPSRWAKAKIRRKEQEIAPAAPVFLTGESAEGISWEEAAADFVRQMHGSHEKKTQDFYRCQLNALSRHMTLRGVTVAAFRVRHMREFQAVRASEGLSERTRRHDAVAARAFARFCASEGYMKDNPLAGYEVPRAEVSYLKAPSEDEVRVLLASVSAMWSAAHNPKAVYAPAKTRTFLARRNYAIFAACVDTGCRIGEVLAFSLSDFDPAQKVLHVRKAKGNRPRSLPISPALVKAITDWLRVRPKCESEHLFISRYGQGMNPAQFGEQLQSARKFARAAYEAQCLQANQPPDAAFLSHFTLHGLRRYSATILSHVDLEVTKSMLGHSSIVTTQHYIRNTADYLRGSHAQAAPLENAVAGTGKNFLVNKRSEAAKKKRLL